MQACTSEAHAQDVEDFGEAEGEFIGGPDPDEYAVGALEAVFDREAIELLLESSAGAQGPSQPQQREAEPQLHPDGRGPAGAAGGPASFVPLPRTIDAVQHGSTVGGAALAELGAAAARERSAQAGGGPWGHRGGHGRRTRAPAGGTPRGGKNRGLGMGFFACPIPNPSTVYNLHASL